MRLDLDDVGKFVALGGTFHTHQTEKHRTYRWPDLWAVPREGVVPEGEPIELPQRVEKVVPGSELTAVIGDDLWQADPEDTWEAIEGFTISNDVTATGNWPGWSDPDHGMITGVGYKLFPTFSPTLTEYIQRGEVDDFADLDVEVRVDDEVAVSGSTAQMAFSIEEMISFASNIVKLHEGDLVALGDPGSPSIYLDEAESVVCRIESIGELSNPVRRL